MTFLSFVAFWAALHVTLAAGMAMDVTAARMRASEIPPVVVPVAAGIPWLTEQSQANYRQFRKDHPNYK